jgi:hypothetical protein
MARGRFKPGHTYDLLYRNWHHDPAPHLFVLWSDADYTVGFNLHYVYLARQGMKLESNKQKIFEAYKRIPKSSFDKQFKIVRERSYFKPIEERLNLYSENISLSRSHTLTKFMSIRYPFMMLSYRKYFTNKLVLSEDFGKGVK